MCNSMERSPALALLAAAANALPCGQPANQKQLVMHQIMKILVHNGFEFFKDDWHQLRDLSKRTGGFNPLRHAYYLAACLEGSSFVLTWEECYSQEPWFAHRAFAMMPGHPRTFLDANRVTKGLGVLLPKDFGGAIDQPHIWQGQQVWWVEDADQNFISIGRYRPSKEARTSVLEIADVDRVAGPCEIKTLTRAEWDGLQLAIQLASQQ